MPRKNLLFIVMDQFRADLIEGALAAHAPLPNLQALRAEAVTFTNHYSVTSPCGPSRASLLTGQYAMNHRAVRNGTPLPQDKPNLARSLRAGGLLPLLFGYTDISPDPRAYPPGDPALRSYEGVLPGFEEVVEMRLEESWPWRAHLLARGYEVPPGAEIFRPKGPSPASPALYAAEDSDTAFLTDRFLEEMAARPPGWMAHLTYIRPHPPLVAPEPWNRLIDPASLPPPVRPLSREEEAASHPLAALALARGPESTVVGFPDLADTPETVAMLRALYIGLAAEVDHHLGRVIAWLKHSGQWDETLLVITGDHGEMLGDHHIWGKMTWHDAAYHVPLILRDPESPEGHGSTCEMPTESVDLAPTMLSLMGCEVPDSMDGVSLAPLLAGKRPESWRDYTFSELDFGNPLAQPPELLAMGLDADSSNLAVLRDARHRLVHFAGPVPPILERREAAPGGDGAEDEGVLLALTRKMLSHRMRNPEGLFAHVLITPEGPRRG